MKDNLKVKAKTKHKKKNKRIQKKMPMLHHQNHNHLKINQIEDPIGKLSKKKEDKPKNWEDNNGFKMKKIEDKEFSKNLRKGERQMRKEEELNRKHTRRDVKKTD